MSRITYLNMHLESKNDLIFYLILLNLKSFLDLSCFY